VSFSVGGGRWGPWGVQDLENQPEVTADDKSFPNFSINCLRFPHVIVFSFVSNVITSASKNKQL
jgi:hypothetical protein